MDFSDRKAPGSGSRLNDAQQQALAEIGGQGLIPAIHTGFCARG
jgi:hypothetical protein